MRIVGGQFRDRALMSPPESRVRPTAERVRVAMMEMLKGDLQEARILDLFAGTGALGLEALSRGGKSADFVETRPSSLHAIRANVALLRLLKKTRIFKRDALPFAAALQPETYDIAFADPPYGSKMLDRLVESWMAVPFSRVLVAEHLSTHVLPKGTASQTFDDSVITLYRIPASAP